MSDQKKVFYILDLQHSSYFQKNKNHCKIKFYTYYKISIFFFNDNMGKMDLTILCTFLNKKKTSFLAMSTKAQNSHISN